MYYNDRYDPTAENEYDYNFQSVLNNKEDNETMLDNIKKLDKGYNKIYRKVKKSNGKVKHLKIELYSSGGVGTNIRDAESGIYYNDYVGSANEDLYFKTVLANGECNSKNGSSILFFISPQSYMSHLGCELQQDIINNWQKKRDIRLNYLKSKSEKCFTEVNPLKQRV
jgi:hypothetical protein